MFRRQDVLSFFAIIASTSVLADSEISKRELASTLCKISGFSTVEATRLAVDAYADDLAKDLVAMKPGLPVDAQARIKDEILSLVFEDTIDISTLDEFIFDWFAQEFTSAELKELIEFYESPIGKKYVSKSTALAAAIEREGEETFRAIQLVVHEKLKDRINRRAQEEGW